MITISKNNKVVKFLSVIFLFTIISSSYGCAKMEEYTKFKSPDGKYKILVMKKTSFFGRSPGSAGDSPGEVRLVNANGEVLQKTDVEMVQLVEKVQWTDKNVYIKLVADWDLPN